MLFDNAYKAARILEMNLPALFNYINKRIPIKLGFFKGWRIEILDE